MQRAGSSGTGADPGMRGDESCFSKSGTPDGSGAYRVQEYCGGQTKRAHHFSPGEGENSYPVVCSGKMEGPFETTVLFQYGEKERETGKLWWRISGEQRAEKLPERLGVAAEHILLLYH